MPLPRAALAARKSFGAADAADSPSAPRQKLKTLMSRYPKNGQVGPGGETHYPDKPGQIKKVKPIGGKLGKVATRIGIGVQGAARPRMNIPQNVPPSNHVIDQRGKHAHGQRKKKFGPRGSSPLAGSISDPGNTF